MLLFGLLDNQSNTCGRLSYSCILGHEEVHPIFSVLFPTESPFCTHDVVVSKTNVIELLYLAANSLGEDWRKSLSVDVWTVDEKCCSKHCVWPVIKHRSVAHVRSVVWPDPRLSVYHCQDTEWFAECRTSVTVSSPSSLSDALLLKIDWRFISWLRLANPAVTDCSRLLICLVTACILFHQPVLSPQMQYPGHNVDL